VNQEGADAADSYRGALVDSLERRFKAYALSEICARFIVDDNR
jgi:hypothetical protein